MTNKNSNPTSTQTVLVMADGPQTSHPANRLRAEMGDLHQEDLVSWERLDEDLLQVTFTNWPWPGCDEPVEAYLRRA